MYITKQNMSALMLYTGGPYVGVAFLKIARVSLIVKRETHPQ
jgi:hypothetical protein